MSFAVPVLLLTWRRPDTTRQVLEALRLVAPSKLYVASDGPRNEVEAKAVQATLEHKSPLYYVVARTEPLRILMTAHKDVPCGGQNVVFKYNAKKIDENDTPDGLNMPNGGAVVNVSFKWEFCVVS